MSSPRLFKQQFFSSTTWTAPIGVRFIIVTGCGGGGGGGGGAAVSGSANLDYYATGGGGGQPAPTMTQVVEVAPGVTYTITIGAGGSGGGFVSVPNYNDGGGKTAGNAGLDGAASVFGSVVFPGGRGGRRGEIIYIAGSNSFALASQLVGLVSYTPFHGADGPSRVSKGGGGGTAGGCSNNIYSSGGGGGQGAFGFDGYPFSGGGGGGSVGGGGGGGGGGEGHDYNNTHDGSAGGPGGSGFVEISWVA